MACSDAELQNVTIHKGDSARLPVRFVDCAGEPVNVTGATLTYTIHLKAATAALVTRTTPTQIVIADNGESAVILLTPANTDFVDKYFHKLKLVDTATNVITTFTGEINFSLREITSCESLVGKIDTDLFVSGGPAYMMDFSSASNAINFRLFM